MAAQFDPRNPSTNEACADFIIVDDNIPPIIAEDDEYFVVSLTSNDNVDVIADQSTARVVIHDNDGIYYEAFHYVIDALLCDPHVQYMSR